MKDLFAATSAERFELPGGDVVLHREPDLGQSADVLFARLREEIEWREETIQMYGKEYLQPRLLAWYGDEDAHYRYSGKSYRPRAWTPTLQDLRERMQDLAETSFNSVLANLYRDHRDGMGLHADDERELGPEPTIASLSLGEERVFRLKHRHRKDLSPIRLPLPSGSLLLMRGKTQQNWKHEVPKSRAPCGPRINLTFRRVFG